MGVEKGVEQTTITELDAATVEGSNNSILTNVGTHEFVLENETLEKKVNAHLSIKNDSEYEEDEVKQEMDEEFKVVGDHSQVECNESNVKRNESHEKNRPDELEKIVAKINTGFMSDNPLHNPWSASKNHAAVPDVVNDKPVFT